MADPQSRGREQSIRRSVQTDILKAMGLDTQKMIYGGISQGFTSPAEEGSAATNANGSGAPDIAALSAVADFAVTAMLSNQNPDGIYKPYNQLTWTPVRDVRLIGYLVLGSSATSTTVAVGASAGADSIELTDVTGFYESAYMILKTGANEELIPLSAIDGNTVTVGVSNVLQYDHPAGSTAIPIEIKAELPGNAKLYHDWDIVGSVGYWYCIASISTSNAIEAYTEIVDVISERDWEAPAMPSEFADDFTGRDLILTWDENSELDLKHYKLDIYNGPGGSLLMSYYGKQTKFTLPLETNIAFTSSGANIYGDPSLYCELYAIDFSGNTSSGATVSAINEPPATPAYAPLSQGFGRFAVMHAPDCTESDYYDTLFYVKVSGAATWSSGAAFDNHYAWRVEEADVGKSIYTKYAYRDIFRQVSGDSPEYEFTPEEIKYVDVNAQTFYIDITDSNGTATATLDGLFDNKKGWSGSGIGDLVDVEYTGGSWEDWIQYDYHFEYKFDVLSWYCNEYVNAYFACSSDGDEWTYYGGTSGADAHALDTGSTLVSYGTSESDAQASYLYCGYRGKSVAKLPEMVQARYWKMFPQGGAVKFSEIRFDTVELATRFIGETINLSDSITIASADNVTNAVKMTNTGVKCYTADDNDLYYTEFNSTGLEAYVNAARKVLIGRLAENNYGLWAINGAFGGTGYSDGAVFMDSGGLSVKDGSSGSEIGWIGKDGATVGAWFKTLGVGGANYAAALIAADASGNVQVSRSVTIGGTTDKIISNAESPGNMVANGGFEQVHATGAHGSTGGLLPCWTYAYAGTWSGNSMYVYDRTTMTVATAQARLYSGRFSLAMYCSTLQRSFITSAKIRIQPGVKYQFSFYECIVDATPTIPYYAKIITYDYAGTSVVRTLTAESATLSNQTMARQTYSFDAGATEMFCAIQFEARLTASTSNWLVLDSVCLEPGNEVSAYTESPLASTDNPIGMSLNTDLGLQIFASAAERIRIGNIGGLSDGASGTVAANTMGIWIKGGFYFLNAAGDAMMTASGNTEDAYVSDTIAAAVFKSTTRDSLMGIIASGTITKRSSFPYTLEVTYASSVSPRVHWRWRPYDTGTSAYGQWIEMGCITSYNDVSGGVHEKLWQSHMLAQAYYDSGAGKVKVIFEPVADHWLYLVGSGGSWNFRSYTFASGTAASFILYNTSAAKSAIWDEIEIEYCITAAGKLS